ncbi:phage tail assembly protein [Kozakia baliensis]|uniref:Uncharacterized protein n=1 Tax=Kozakia baliensis TaxID=153496 RepID=A0A1D8UTE9_9PROT|nr:phage tail assembly protein [Kozakia baliensis]AOX16920.1 hypothetical protein A0U89_06975 [Kozakia baliensis]GBR25590.1 hypothetical protein AA0488_0690 [Kozakia baliensis NRIC 0488]GEL64033.1 hypothetical protein KBA01_13190 [Kozakia baliensis]
MSEQKVKPKPEAILIIPLAEPITVKGANYTELTLKEPTGRAVLDAEKHLKGSSIGPSDLRLYSFTLVAAVSGVPFEVLRDNFPISVINEGTRYLQGFIEAGEPIGDSEPSA